MSRIGKQIIIIPQGTEVKVSDGVISVKGKGGELRKKLHPSITVEIDGAELKVIPLNDSRETFALWGTFASIIKSLIEGVNNGFKKELILEGVGYKVNVQGSVVVLEVGFSHKVEMQIPEGLNVTAEKNLITVTGIDKEKVGQFASEIRAVKKPEPYKGKGIRYSDEVIRRKEGKRAA